MTKIIVAAAMLVLAGWVVAEWRGERAYRRHARAERRLERIWDEQQARRDHPAGARWGKGLPPAEDRDSWPPQELR